MASASEHTDTKKACTDSFFFLRVETHHLSICAPDNLPEIRIQFTGIYIIHFNYIYQLLVTQRNEHAQPHIKYGILLQKCVEWHKKKRQAQIMLNEARFKRGQHLT